MKITGYKLQHALREFGHQREVLSQQFADSLTAFEGDIKISPLAAMEGFRKVEDAIAILQTAQAVYNLNVKVKVHGQEITLCEAVKRVGGAGRMEKMWRSAAANKKDRYSSYHEDVRNPGVQVAKRQIGVEQATAMAKAAAKSASALREAIQMGNATEVEVVIEGLSPSLFE